jgi:transcriptional regulator with XRE-family HTH domain
VKKNEKKYTEKPEKTKNEKNYLYEGLGFPVRLASVTLVNYKGDWLPQVDVLELERTVAKSLSESHINLTGNHIRFIRSFLKQSLREFAKSIGVSHIAVKKWESKENKPTAMTYPTEVVIRLLFREAVRRSEKKAMDSTEKYLNQFIGGAAESFDSSYEDEVICA